MARSPIATAVRKRPPYFWWLMAHALALCFCSLSWILTTYIFENPELPKNYALLKKIGQAPVPQPFTVLKAPMGESLRPEQIYRQYAMYAMPDRDSKRNKLNTRLLRSYLQGYKESVKPIYIEGAYRILQIRPLTDADIVSPGFVIRAQSLVQPGKDHPVGPYPVIIEYIFPCENKAAFTWFKPGDLLRIQKIPDCVAMLHVAHLGTTDEPIVNLTVTPIAYSEYKIGESRVMSIAPPKMVNLNARMPLFPPTVPKTSP